jgi:hypothetical protein
MAQQTRYDIIKQASRCKATNKPSTTEELLETVFSVRRNQE